MPYIPPVIPKNTKKEIAQKIRSGKKDFRHDYIEVTEKGDVRKNLFM